jgi:hypothetical protein
MQQQINNNQKYQVYRFTFTDTQSNDIHIVFLPQILRGDRKIPQLDYQGAEGKFTFRGKQIKQQPSNLGLLVSVTLKINADGGGLDFAFVLPSVDLAGQKSQDFETIAIATTRSQKIVANHVGTEFIYKVLTLKGVAEKLPSSSDWLKAPTTWHEEIYNLIDFPRF